MDKERRKQLFAGAICARLNSRRDSVMEAEGLRTLLRSTNPHAYTTYIVYHLAYA